jgi:ribosomal protein L11 methyltransferase
MKRWLTVTFTIPDAFGEAISNFVMEEGATGIEELDGDSGWVRLRAYFEEDGRKRSILRTLHRYLTSLEGIDPEISRTRIETVSIADQDWGENWKRFFKPVEVGERFVIKPPWHSVRLKRRQISIEITPGMAFGTGTHATTKLCIRALEKRIKGRGVSVLDVGTGSGILAIASAKLGAVEVWGVDIDGVAVKDAREHVKRNGVSEIVRIRKGSIGDVQKKFDVVVANIDKRSLMKMRGPLLRHVKGQGFLILSGILEEEGDGIRQHYMEAGQTRWARMERENGWVGLTIKKS